MDKNRGQGDGTEGEARGEADTDRIEREHLLAQMREANEHLVLAMLRADQLVEEAIAARGAAAERAEIQSEARRRAESQAAELRANEDALRARASEAHASSQARDEFVAMLGHELRAPLAPILIALDLIMLDGSDPHAREHSIIARQLGHLSQLVEDLLDVSRIRNGKLHLHRRPVELAEVVARAVELAGPLVAAKHHTLHVVVPSGLVVDGDLLRLAQAVANLVTNAAKYTPTGGAITVTAARHADTVLLRVRDTGIGISAAMLPHVFEMFAQDHNARGRAQGGLGLGLAIVKSLVTMHDGAVTALSAGPGRGSEFVIVLPAIPARPAAPAGEPAMPAVEIAIPRKLLLVGDRSEAISLMGDALSALGHDVRVASDEASAVAIIEDYIPEIVLLDIGVPVLHEYEIARRLRTRLASHGVHFIAITSGVEPDPPQPGADGFDACLVKPVDVATIEHAIEDVPARSH
jgi:signal transduction histidine kinase